MEQWSGGVMGGEANGFVGIPASHSIVRLHHLKPILQYSDTPTLRCCHLLDALPRCTVFP